MCKKTMTLLIALFLFVTASPVFVQAQGDEQVVVMGHVIDDLYLDFVDVGMCHLVEGDVVWAVGRTKTLWKYVSYTSSPNCEGPVWISRSANNVVWDEPDQMVYLPLVEYSVAEPVDLSLDEVNEICGGLEYGDPLGDPPDRTPFRIVTSQGDGMDNYPPEMLAMSADEIDVVVCAMIEYRRMGECRYTDGSETHDVALQRPDMHIRLVNYATGEMFRNVWFNGTLADCPETIYTLSPIVGTHPSVDEWSAWIRDIAYGGAEDIPRTVVNANGMNARAEATTSSAVLAQLAYDTPVTLIARNEAADWVVALLPDGQQAWLYTSLLRIALKTNVDALPVAEGPAAEVPLPIPVPLLDE